MISRTAKGRSPAQTAGLPDRRKSARQGKAPRNGKPFYRPTLKVTIAEFLDAHAVPGYN